MNAVLKAGCLIIYAMALAAFALPSPTAVVSILQKVALALLVIHGIELMFVFKYVKAYEGPLLKSIVLTLLFGLLHWLPIAKRIKATTESNPS